MYVCTHDVEYVCECIYIYEYIHTCMLVYIPICMLAYLYASPVALGVSFLHFCILQCMLYQYRYVNMSM